MSHVALHFVNCMVLYRFGKAPFPFSSFFCNISTQSHVGGGEPTLAGWRPFRNEVGHAGLGGPRGHLASYWRILEKKSAKMGLVENCTGIVVVEVLEVCSPWFDYADMV